MWFVYVDPNTDYNTDDDDDDDEADNKNNMQTNNKLFDFRNDRITTYLLGKKGWL